MDTPPLIQTLVNTTPENAPHTRYKKMLGY